MTDTVSPIISGVPVRPAYRGRGRPHGAFSGISNRLRKMEVGDVVYVERKPEDSMRLTQMRAQNYINGALRSPDHNSYRFCTRRILDEDRVGIWRIE